MIVAYGSMAGGNLKAINRVVRIVSEMDRYISRAIGAGSPCPLGSRPLLRRRQK